jgi:hypothetical protein
MVPTRAVAPRDDAPQWVGSGIERLPVWRRDIRIDGAMDASTGFALFHHQIAVAPLPGTR